MRWFPLLVVAGILGIKKRRPEIASAGRESSRTAKTVRRRCLLQALIARLSAKIAIDPGKISLASRVPVFDVNFRSLKFNQDLGFKAICIIFELAILLHIYCANGVSRAQTAASLLCKAKEIRPRPHPVQRAGCA
ncbi:hypothetical protein [Rhizobium mongolense]|uniref:hypothetical protein n=1 Tax=Rhizobium mongolense TaxID=57676 RepID=UPI001FF06D92|nr:hypothetical protein [Rhizobium mongolense]